MERKKIQRGDLLHPELSYQIIGVLFEVYNSMGSGYLEKHYQKAVAALLRKLEIKFVEQALVEIIVGDVVVFKGRADFIIEEKIILELKKGDSFRKDNIGQLYSYLKAKKIQLGILANFTTKGLLSKRLVNIIK